MKTHQLKILPEYFREVALQRKLFEIRSNDRKFEVGDIVCLKEFDGKKFTGSEIHAHITYILQDVRFLQPGYVAFSIRITEYIKK